MLKPRINRTPLLLPTKTSPIPIPTKSTTLSNSNTLLLQQSPTTAHLKILHAQLLINGLHQSNPILSTKLLQSYFLAGDSKTALLFFDSSVRHLERTPFSWNVMLRGYSINNQPENALKLYNRMLLSAIEPDNFTFAILLKACACLSGLNCGSEIHACAIVNGYSSNAFVEASLIDLYMKSERSDLARQVFDRSSKRDIALWNSMICGFLLGNDAGKALEIAARMGELSSLKPDRITLVGVLSASGKLGIPSYGKESHCYIIRHGFDSAIAVANSLIDFYCKCECLDSGIRVFTTMADRDSSSWNVMISGFHENGNAEHGLMLFRGMLLEGVKPTLFTILTVLPICAFLGALQVGKELHAHITKTGLQLDFRIATALIDMYAKCGSMDDAHRAFGYSLEKDLISWNAMITGCALNSHWHEVLELFSQMQLIDLKPDRITLNNLLITSENLRAIQYGQSIHGYMIRNRFETEGSLLNCLASMYAKCGRIDKSYASLITHAKTDPIPWNGLLLAINPSEALRLFLQMQHLTNIKPNLVTFLNLLTVCADLAAPSKGRLIHGCIVKSGFQASPIISASLVNMYAKCGDIGYGISVFDIMEVRDTISWSTAISAYGVHGFGLASLQLFAQMQAENVRIDHVAFAEILSACTHSGLIEEGWECFKIMERGHSMVPKHKHYMYMVDLLGRAGQLEKAKEFIDKMPIKPDARIWRPLLSSCRIHGNVEMAEKAFKELYDLEPENTANYALMSNIYAEEGRWDGVAEIRSLLERKGLIKTPGCSWIEETTKKSVTL